MRDVPVTSEDATHFGEEWLAWIIERISVLLGELGLVSVCAVEVGC